MSEAESKSQPNEKPAAPPDPNERFRYIGFGIYPKTPQTFWKSEKEAEEYAKTISIHRYGETFERDFSSLQVIPVSRADKIIVTIVSVVMLLTVAMPWVSFRTMSGTDFTMYWPQALGTLLGGLGTAFAGGWAVGLSAIMGLILIIGGPVVGVWSLAMLWMKAKSDEEYFKRLKRPLGLGYYLFFALFAMFILSFVGGNIPGYSTWGLINPGDSYGAMSLIGVMSYAPYLTAALGLVAGVKSGDL
ncbi:MAG: hypothetical protein GF341_04905 [candidate division Zixibacteria bacterium]|nr:hypothetical protein [candidate division Zixibacteria bacterium]